MITAEARGRRRVCRRVRAEEHGRVAAKTVAPCLAGALRAEEHR